MDLVLYVEVGPPVADFRSTLQALDGQHRESILIVDGDLLLVLLNESGIGGGWKIMERPVRDNASGIILGRNIVRRKGGFFGLCVTEDGESNSPRY